MPIDVPTVYEKLKKINANNLNIDPTVGVITPAFLQEKTLECELHSAVVERYALEVGQELDSAERHLRTEQENFNIKRRHALIHSESIKKLPTGKEREAAVEELLEDDRKATIQFEDKVNSLRNLAGAVKTVHIGINRKDGRVKVLMRLMDQQINRLNVGLPDDPEVKQLAAGLAEIDRQEMTIEDVESSSEELKPVQSGDESATGHPDNGTPEADGQGSTDEALGIGIASYLTDDLSELSNEGEEGDSSQDETAEIAQSDDTDDTSHETETVAVPTEDTGNSVGDLNLDDIVIDAGGTSTDSPTEAAQDSPPESSVTDDIQIDDVLAETAVDPPSEESSAEIPSSVSSTPDEEATSKSSGSSIDIEAILADFE